MSEVAPRRSPDRATAQRDSAVGQGSGATTTEPETEDPRGRRLDNGQIRAGLPGSWC